MTMTSFIARTLVGFLLLIVLLGYPAQAQTPDVLLMQEADYLAACSFTGPSAQKCGGSPDSAAYGVLNNVRIIEHGADWVNQSMDAAMGLAAAAEQLKMNGHPVGRYDTLLHDHFMIWILAHRQPFMETGSPDAGAATSELVYDSSGHLTKRGTPSTGATGQVVCAMWKYGEYLRDTGQEAEARHWEEAAWPLAQSAGSYLLRNIDPVYGMVYTRSSDHQMWTHESVLTVDALACLTAWSHALHHSDAAQYSQASVTVRAGIEKMRDDGDGKADGWKNYYKFRSSDNPAKPQYGDSVDQLCFAPYEFDALPASQPFAKAISDWWTQGSYGTKMTQETVDSGDWRFYGCHWHYYFDKRVENGYLYPGPTLQLAALEWKYATATGDQTILKRARMRYQWVVDSSKSGLLYEPASDPDGGIRGGLVDWRSGSDRTQKAPDWQRFSDTSAYLIYCTLMFGYGKDYKFVPVP